MLAIYTENRKRKRCERDLFIHLFICLFDVRLSVYVRVYE